MLVLYLLVLPQAALQLWDVEKGWSQALGQSASPPRPAAQSCMHTVYHALRFMRHVHMHGVHADILYTCMTIVCMQHMDAGHGW